MADYEKVSRTDEAHTDDSSLAVHAPASDSTTRKQLNGRRRLCLTLLPVASVSEYKHVLMQLALLSWPVILYMVAIMVYPMTSIIFSGHLGKDEIVASSLAQAIIHVFWRAVVIGFNTSADTLFSQTYGSKNKKRVGIILQRFLFINILVAVICSGILLNTEGILLLFGQDAQIARMASGYAMVFIAAMPADSVFIVLVKYLESQSVVRPLFIIILIMGALNILIHFLMVSALELGLLGAVAAQVITYYLGVVMILGYICKTKIYKKTWPGWSWDCLQEWDIITKLSIAGMGTVCVEWWCLEAGFFITGLYGKTTVGAHAVLFSACGITWSVSAGVGIGGAILIGNYLGENRPTKAHITAVCCVIVTAILGVVYMIIIYSLRSVLGYIFTKEVDVIQLVESVALIVCIGEICDSVNAASFGILRGCGYQYVGAVVCVLGFLVGLPLGVLLMFNVGLGLKGLWLGLLSAFSMEFVLLLIFIIFFINWGKEAVKAQKRAAVLPKKESLEIDSKSGVELESLEKCPDGVVEVEVKPGAGVSGRECRIGGDMETGEDGGVEGVGNPKCNGKAEQSHDHQQDPSGEATKMLPRDCDDGREVIAGPESGVTRDNEEEEEEGSNEEGGIQVLTLSRLSTAQLVWRRGLALFLCLAFLVASVFVSIVVVPAVRPSFQDSVIGMGNYTIDYYISEILEMEM